MGIITDPGYELFVEDPTECFYPKKTPKKLFCRISGVKRGEAWTPDWGSTMNGSYILEWVWANVWDYVKETTVIHTDIRYNTTLLVAANEKTNEVFRFSQIQGCVFCAANEYQNPAGVFYEGYLSLTMREEGSSIPSIQTTCKLAGIPPDKKTFAEIYNDDEGKRIFRLARQKDGTCIKIKF